MAIIQIIYLILNVISTAFCIFMLFAEIDFDFLFNFLDFIKKKLGTVVALICSSLVILLLVPTIALISVLLIFIMAIGYYTD